MSHSSIFDFILPEEMTDFCFHFLLVSFVKKHFAQPSATHSHLSSLPLQAMSLDTGSNDGQHAPSEHCNMRKMKVDFPSMNASPNLVHFLLRNENWHKNIRRHEEKGTGKKKLFCSYLCHCSHWF